MPCGFSGGSAGSVAVSAAPLARPGGAAVSRRVTAERTVLETSGSELDFWTNLEAAFPGELSL